MSACRTRRLMRGSAKAQELDTRCCNRNKTKIDNKQRQPSLIRFWLLWCGSFSLKRRAFSHSASPRYYVVPQKLIPNGPKLPTYFPTSAYDSKSRQIQIMMMIFVLMERPTQSRFNKATQIKTFPPSPSLPLQTLPQA